MPYRSILFVSVRYFELLNCMNQMFTFDLLTTACGKLARNLETLIDKTQMWSNGNNGTSLGTPVSQGTAQAPAETDAVIPDVRPPPAVVNGQWLNQGPGPQKPHETTQNPQRDGLFTEVGYTS